MPSASQRVFLAFGLVMVAFYIGLGVALMVLGEEKLHLTSLQSIGLGTILIGYGCFRLYRYVKSSRTS